MAAKLSSGVRSKFTTEHNHDINVTPFVDVMLVLLIIFMVAAPLAAPSIEVALPPANAKPSVNPPKPIYISIKADGTVYLGDGEVTPDTIGSELNDQIGTRNPAEERIFIRADKKARYGTFMQVMNNLQDNGYYSVALVGEDIS